MSESSNTPSLLGDDLDPIYFGNTVPCRVCGQQMVLIFQILRGRSECVEGHVHWHWDAVAAIDWEIIQSLPELSPEERSLFDQQYQFNVPGLASKDREVRRQSLAALQRLFHQWAMPVREEDLSIFRPLLNDTEPNITLQMIYFFHLKRAVLALPDLQQALLHEKRPIVRPRLAECVETLEFCLKRK